MPTALILGVSGGIGGAIATDLGGAGWRVVGAGRSPTTATPVDAYQVCDATDRDAVDALLAATAETADGPLAVVLAVGSILLKPAHRTSSAEWAHTIAVNLTTAFHVVAAAGRHLRQGGSVVLFSSAAAGTGLANHEAIAAAKAGVDGLVRSAAATYAGRGLRVNALAPGLIDTPLAAPMLGTEAARAASAKLHPLGRIGTPEDLLPAIRWLIDPGCWTTGAVVPIDGGLARQAGR